jgi:hypothetical protein
MEIEKAAAKAAEKKAAEVDYRERICKTADIKESCPRYYDKVRRRYDEG